MTSNRSSRPGKRNLRLIFIIYDACERDCEGLRVDLEAQRVSGLTDELIACWGSSRTCEQARACDGGEW